VISPTISCSVAGMVCSAAVSRSGSRSFGAHVALSRCAALACPSAAERGGEAYTGFALSSASPNDLRSSTSESSLGEAQLVERSSWSATLAPRRLLGPGTGLGSAPAPAPSLYPSVLDTHPPGVSMCSLVLTAAEQHLLDAVCCIQFCCGCLFPQRQGLHSVKACTAYAHAALRLCGERGLVRLD